VSAVFDTSLLVDYLRGIKSAKAVLAQFPHSSITVTTWIEVMAAAPESLEAQTRNFLRTFERLAINEAIADRALALIQQHAALSMRHALPWATAQVNTLVYVTVDFPKLAARDTSVLVPYKDARRMAR
jgi:predicted nucleic acid-binding protein